MASYQQYNFPDTLKGSYFVGTQFTLYSDVAQTIPIVLTGATIEMAMKISELSVSPDHLLSTFENTISITDAVNGVFQVVGQNMNVPAAEYFYDIKINFIDGSHRIYIKGKWKILISVSG